MRWNEMSERERDALVATKIFGLGVKHLTQKELRITNEDGEEETFDLLTGYVVRGKYGYEPIPHYTTSMDAAWQVVEKMKEGDWGAYCRELDYVITHHKWDRSQDKPYVTWFEQFLWSFRAEAICLAALRAYSVEVE